MEGLRDLEVDIEVDHIAAVVGRRTAAADRTGAADRIAAEEDHHHTEVAVRIGPDQEVEQCRRSVHPAYHRMNRYYREEA